MLVGVDISHPLPLVMEVSEHRPSAKPFTGFLRVKKPYSFFTAIPTRAVATFPLVVATDHKK